MNVGRNGSKILLERGLETAAVLAVSKHVLQSLLVANRAEVGGEGVQERILV